MKLEFSNKRINEYYEGGLHFVNEGQSFEVPPHQGGEMLKAFHILDGERVPVFKMVGGPKVMEKQIAEAAAETEREKIEAEADHIEEVQGEILATAQQPVETKVKKVRKPKTVKKGE